MKPRNYDLEAMTATEARFFGRVLGVHDNMRTEGDGYRGRFPRSARELRRRMIADLDLRQLVERIEDRLLEADARGFGRVLGDYHAEVGGNGAAAPLVTTDPAERQAIQRNLLDV